MVQALRDSERQYRDLAARCRGGNRFTTGLARAVHEALKTEGWEGR